MSVKANINVIFSGDTAQQNRDRNRRRRGKRNESCGSDTQPYPETARAKLKAKTLKCHSNLKQSLRAMVPLPALTQSGDRVGSEALLTLALRDNMRGQALWD